MMQSEEHEFQGVNRGVAVITKQNGAGMHRTFCEIGLFSGNFAATLQYLYLIWSHQIQPGKEKLVYGKL